MQHLGEDLMSIECRNVQLFEVLYKEKFEVAMRDIYYEPRKQGHQQRPVLLYRNPSSRRGSPALKTSQRTVTVGRSGNTLLWAGCD